MKLYKLASLPIMAVLAVVLAACGQADPGAGDDVTTPTPTEVVGPPVQELDEEEILANPLQVLYDTLDFFNIRLAVDNPGTPLAGGELRWAMGSTAPFPGIWDGVHWHSSLDADVRALTHTGLLAMDIDMFAYNNPHALASFTYDREAQSITITKNHVSHWHDGVPVTLDDLVFAHYVIAHPDYQGPRWGSQVQNVVGAVEFHNGEADHISGLVLSEDQMELTMYFIDFPPDIIAFGFWSTPIPRHHWEGIPVGEMFYHPRARHEALGNGPFIIDSVVPGESIRFVRNDNFWAGPAILDSIVLELIDPMMVPLAMQQGLYHVGGPFPQSQFTEHFRYMTNVQFLSNPFMSNTMFWLGFRMGTWDAEEGRSIPFDEPRISRPVREAIALSIDHLGAGQELFNGLVVPVGSAYWPTRRAHWVNPEIETFNHFDPERAMQILDDAGYLRGPDGYRTRPDGSDLTIVYMASVGSPANEVNRALEIQNWSDIGLRVVFYQDRLIEAPLHLDVRQHEADGGVVDMWTFGWGQGANPNPVNMFGPTTTSNWQRYTNPQLEAIFDRFSSEDMWDPDFRMETISMWEQAFMDTRVNFPNTVAIGLAAINNSVGGIGLEFPPRYSGPGPFSSNGAINGIAWQHVYLTAPDTYIDGQ
ncbi:MAG: ABC transporter substrate-binding protein [Defluviitaleaceae bacterium]|nr:ABC transporter substrate-binding protein [Defluviitaleaceae bacterium]